MQGHIALDQAVFPENTPGFVLDAFARSSLWKVGLDYRHGNLFNFHLNAINNNALHYFYLIPLSFLSITTSSFSFLFSAL